MKSFKDSLGKEIKAGDFLFYITRRSSSMYSNFCFVTSVNNETNVIKLSTDFYWRDQTYIYNFKNVILSSPTCIIITEDMLKNTNYESLIDKRKEFFGE